MTAETAPPLPPGGYWEGRLVRLRAMRADDDADHWFEQRTDSEAERFLNCTMPFPATPAETRAFTERYAEFGALDERIMFVIENHDGDVVGGINIHSRSERHGTFEAGSRIYRAHRGHGYGFDASLLVLRYGFHELRLQKYVIRCLASNDPMRRHAARLGCQQEGRLRRQFYTDGRYQDELIFGLLREEFDALLEREQRKHHDAPSMG